MSIFFKILFIFSIILPLGLKPTMAQESILVEMNHSLLDSLIAKAKANYPRSKILTNKTQIAKNNISKSNVSFLDALNFSYLRRLNDNNSVNLVDPNLLSGYQFGVNINLGLLLEKPFEVKNAKSEYKISKLEEDEYVLNLTRDVKNKYYDYLKYLTLVKVTSKASLDAEALLKEVKHKYEKGEVSLEVYTNVLLNTANQNQAKLEAEAQFFTAKAFLEEIAGVRLEDIK